VLATLRVLSAHNAFISAVDSDRQASKQDASCQVGVGGEGIPLTIDEFEVTSLAVAVVGDIVISLQTVCFHLQIEYARH